MKIRLKYAQLLVCASILNSTPLLMCMTRTQAKTSWYLQGSRKILTDQPCSLPHSRAQSPTPLRSKTLLKPLEISQSALSKSLISEPEVQKPSNQKPILPKLDFSNLQNSKLTSEKSTLAKHPKKTVPNPRIASIANILRREETTDNFSQMDNLNPTVVELKDATNLLRKRLLQSKLSDSLFMAFYEDTDSESDNENTNHILFINDGEEMNQSVHSSSEKGSTQLKRACSRLERESTQLQQSNLQNPLSTYSSLFVGITNNDYYSPREDSLCSINDIVSQ